ncbi:hypothetical protein CDIK_1096 [Cucumispora dikerogammari]|nr:hypothetical protein CDIK_1096 [Cucumispora dikerogammari]
MELVISDRETKFKDPLIIKAFIEAINNFEDVTHLILDFFSINLNIATILSLKTKEMIKLKHITLKLDSALSEEIEEIFIKMFENINGSLIESLNFNFCFVHSGAPGGLCKFLGQAKNLENTKIFDQKDKKSTGIISILRNLVNSTCKIKYLNVYYKNFDLITERPGILINQLATLERLFIYTYDGPDDNNLNVFIEDIKHLKLKQLTIGGNKLSLEAFSNLGNMFGKYEMKRLDMSSTWLYVEELIAFLDGWEQGINTKNQQDDILISLEKLALTQLNTKKMNELFKLHKHFFQHAEEEERRYKQVLSLPFELLEQGRISFLANFMKDKMNIKIEFVG